MGPLFGCIAAAVSALPAFWLADRLTGNLDTTLRLPVLVALTLSAVVIGFLVGGAIARRRRRTPIGLPAFAALAAGFGGGMIGAITIALVAGTYLYSYGHWPEGIVSEALYVLAIPAFAAVGWFAGMAIGAAVGLFGGALLRLFAFSSR